MAHTVTDHDDPMSSPGALPGSTTHQAPDGSTDEIARLRTEIALRRQRLDTTLHRLEHRVSEDLDWRRRVAANPWKVLLAAALAGYAVGRLMGGPRSQPPLPETGPS